ncbi:MAG: hypothetical protein ABIP81_08900 [Terriglobales bacterium]
MIDSPELLCPAVDARDEAAPGVTPAQALTHDEQIAEYVRLVEESRMRT